MTDWAYSTVRRCLEAGESVMVVGYSQRNEWPDNDKFTLCAWFVDPDALQEAMKAAGVMARRRTPERKRAKQKRRKQG